MQGDFRIGDRTVVPTLNQILCGGTAVRVEPKVMRVLLRLAARRGEVARREELIQEVWPDTFVTDDVLKRCISDLRKALGDDRQEPRFIETIPKAGYRLLTAIEPVEPEGEDGRAQASRTSARAAGDNGTVRVAESTRQNVRRSQHAHTLDSPCGGCRSLDGWCRCPVPAPGAPGAEAHAADLDDRPRVLPHILAGR